jgi:transposase
MICTRLGMATYLKGHLERAQIKERWKRCNDLVEKGHWQIIWLASEKDGPINVSELSRQVGMNHSWVGRLLKRYNEQGAEGLRDRRAENGRQGLLDEQGVQQLRSELDKEPAGGGLWNGPKVAAWIGQRLGREVKPQVGWLQLKRLGMSLQVPRPRHVQSANEAEQGEYKKSLPNHCPHQKRTPAKTGRTLGAG